MERSTRQLIAELVNGAGLPFDQARAAPAGIYSDEALLAIERERVFAGAWVCVARERDLPDPGDYRCFEIAAEPLILIRDGEGVLRAMSNVCRHRGARLLNDDGHVARIVCPYHAWTYGLDGRCEATPFMQGVDTCLPSFPVCLWQGWVYVSLAANPAPLAAQLGPLDDYFDNHSLSAYVPLHREREIWRTNWKLLIENFIDPYHLFKVHPETVDRALPTRLTECLPGGEAFTWFLQWRVEDTPYEYSANLTAASNRVSAQKRACIPIACVFPTHLISVSPDRLFWMTVQPRGVGEVEVLWGLDIYPDVFPAGVEGERYAAQLCDLFRRVNEQDKRILGPLQRNAGSRFTEQGRLSRFEQTVWEFHRYLARCLSD